MNYENMLLVIKHGVYYNPANKHYSYKGFVTCNRCFKTNLDVCIGFNEYDLCLNCLQEILIHEKKMETKKDCNDLCINDVTLKTINFDENKNAPCKNPGYQYDSDDYQSDMMQDMFDLFG